MEHQLGARLIANGVINAEQLETVLSRSRSSGAPLLSACLDLGFADERSLARILSQHLGMPAAVLSSCAIPLALVKLLPQTGAQRLGAIPLRLEGNNLSVAMIDPQDMRAIDELRFGSGCRITPYAALAATLKYCVEAYYRHSQLANDGMWLGDDVDTVRTPPPEGLLELVRPALPRPAVNPAFSISTPLEDLATEWTDAPLTTRLWRGPDNQQQAGQRILVIDDEADLRKLLTDYLQQLGYVVRSASDGNEAMQMLRSGLPDLVILDAMLPGVHGFDLCRMLKTSPTTQHLPVIMISAVYRGWGFSDDVKRLYGADVFLEKPFRLEELKGVIEAQLKGENKPLQQPGEKAQVLVQRASAAYRQGQLQESADHLQAAIALTPFSAELHQRLGKLYEQMQQAHRAMLAYERAVEIAPEFNALVALAQLYERQGFVRKALETWERGLWIAKETNQVEAIRGRIQALWTKV